MLLGLSKCYSPPEAYPTVLSSMKAALGLLCIRILLSPENILFPYRERREVRSLSSKSRSLGFFSEL